MKNRKLLSVGTPLSLSKLNTLLGTVDVAEHPEATVKHHDGQLIIEEPNPTFANTDGE